MGLKTLDVSLQCFARDSSGLEAASARVFGLDREGTEVLHSPQAVHAYALITAITI